MLISALYHKSKFNFELFKKEFNFLGFHAIILMKTFPLVYQLMELEGFIFWGYRQTGFQNRHMKTCLHTKKFRSKLKIRS